MSALSIDEHKRRHWCGKSAVSPNQGIAGVLNSMSWLGTLAKYRCVNMQCSSLYHGKELWRCLHIFMTHYYDLLSKFGPSQYYLRCVQITKGLLQKYGAERVRDTPITEVCILTAYRRVHTHTHTYTHIHMLSQHTCVHAHTHTHTRT
jgi:hypothetical protein